MKLARALQVFRFALAYAGLRALIGLTRLMPLSLSVSCSAAAWRMLAPRINPRRHRMALENLRIAFPDKSEAEREAICMAHWENLGRVIAETVQMDRLLADPSRIEVCDPHVLSRYRSKLGSAIGVSLHMGNWELSIWPLLTIDANPAAVYRAVDNPYVDRFLRSKRKALYPGGLFARRRSDAGEDEDLRIAHRLMNYVRHGGRLGIVCDQHYRRGIPTPFFGRSALTQPIAGVIARRTGARVWMARCLRIGVDSRFRIEIKELKIPRTANQSDDIRRAAEGMRRQFEHWIREAPEQWLWSHRIWR